MQRKYIHLFTAILIAGLILLSLGWLGHRGGAEKPRAGSANNSTSAADFAASKEHEVKALGVELEKKPNHAPILMRMAQLEREMGKPGEAAAHLRQLAEAEPDNIEAHLELGRTLYETNDVAGAIEQTNRVLTLSPKNVDALYNLGAIYANVNKPDLARQYWTVAVAADPQSDSGKRAQSGLSQLGAPLPAPAVKRHP